jgi:hypothetical protein
MKTAKTLMRAGFTANEAYKLEAEQRELMRMDRAGLLRPVNSHREAALLHDGYMTPAGVLAERRAEAADLEWDREAYEGMSEAERDAHDNL